MATFPTNWLAAGNGLVMTSEGFGVENGLNFFEFRITGTAASNTALLAFEDSQQIESTIGDDWTQTFWLWRVAGDFTGLTTWQIRFNERDINGSFGTGHFANIVPTTTAQQFSVTATTVDSDIAYVLPRMGVSHTTGTVDVTMRIANVTMQKSTPVTYDDTNIITIRRLPSVQPRHTTIVGYGRNHTVDTGDGVDTAATDAFKAFARQEYRTSQSTDATVLTAHPQAKEQRVDTGIFLKADADTEAARLQVLHGDHKAVYELQLKSQPFAVDIGDVVTVDTNRFGLSGGQKFIIVSLFEDSETNEVVVQVWG